MSSNKTRQMSVNGSFYPAETSELERYFQHFESFLKEQNISLSYENIKALIVPHAGYIYSGYSAYIAYKALLNSNIKNLLILAPSHRVYLDGMSLCKDLHYQTPFGQISTAQELLKKLEQKFDLNQSIIHAEHSSEVQFPMIKYLLPHVNIVEIIYGNITPNELSLVIDEALLQKDTGVIISTDLSHFHNLEKANTLDNICVEAIKNLDMSSLHNGCEACGILGVEAMMISAKKHTLKPHILDYRTSADASGDSSRVVGYMSACFSQENS